jgi:hypothetical protein
MEDIALDDNHTRSALGCGEVFGILALLLWFAGVPVVMALGAVIARGGDLEATLEGLITGKAGLIGMEALGALAVALVLQLLAAVPLAVFTRRGSALSTIGWLMSAAALYAFVTGAATALLPAGDLRGPGLVTGAGQLAVSAAAVLVLSATFRTTGLQRGGLLAEMGWGLPLDPAMVLAVGVVAALLIPWLLVGTLGDVWLSLAIALSALAVAVGEETLFRGIGHVALNRAFGSTTMAGIAGLLAFMAYLCTGVLPGLNFGALGGAVLGWAIGLLALELRVRGRTVWPAVLARWSLVVAAPLFTDSRLTQSGDLSTSLLSAQLGAVTLAALLGVGLFGVRKLMAGQHAPAAVRWALAGVLAVMLWGAAGLLWTTSGEPGFHPDGFMIVLKDQADLSNLPDDPLARRVEVRRRLIEVAERTQPPVLAELDRRGLPYRRFYLINAVRVDAGWEQMGDFARLPEVAETYLNPNVRPYRQLNQLSETATGGSGAPKGDAPGLDVVGADQVWKLGVRGQGIVVASADTGVDWTHPALKTHYRGWNDGQVDHNYNWYDPWGASTEPFADGPHGTHTTGTMVGDDGTHHVGMAPEAQWIACRNMRYGIGNPSAYIACMEFFLAPFPLNGDPFRDGDPARAPDVINNSWGCPTFEGCAPDTLKLAVEHLRAGAVMMVVSAGNEGPQCSSLSTPPANYAAVFTVGAVDDRGDPADFTNRGPVIVGTDRALKPDVAAPGVDVRSTTPGGAFGENGWSGTSMAGPHVAGLVALMWSANPQLRGHIDQTEALIRETAGDQAVHVCPLGAGGACTCGEEKSGATPNYTFGYGVIDALKAVQAAMH